jgi:hypothetical protein
VNRGLATAAVAILFLPLVAGCGLLPGATASPADSAAASPLAAGTYTSKSFQPAATYTVPGDWTNPTDSAAYFNLMPVQDQNNGLHLFHNPQALSQAADCPSAPEPGVGTSSLELVTWIRSLKGLSVTQPALVTIGGIPGTSIDASIAPNWTQSCSFANGIPTVPLFYGKDQNLRWVVAGPEKLRLAFLDVPGQGTVVVDLDSFDGTGFESLIGSASPIVKSLSFAH